MFSAGRVNVAESSDLLRLPRRGELCTGELQVPGWLTLRTGIHDACASPSNFLVSSTEKSSIFV